MKISILHGRRAVTGAAFALLAIGGVGAVTAASSGASTPPQTSNTAVVSTDTGPNVQQGDQSAPDTDNVQLQQGDQSGPDTAASGAGGEN